VPGRVIHHDVVEAEGAVDDGGRLRDAGDRVAVAGELVEAPRRVGIACPGSLLDEPRDIFEVANAGLHVLEGGDEDVEVDDAPAYSGSSILTPTVWPVWRSVTAKA